MASIGVVVDRSYKIDLGNSLSGRGAFFNDQISECPEQGKRGLRKKSSEGTCALKVDDASGNASYLYIQNKDVA